MSKEIDELYSSIDRGREGRNIGLKTGIPKMDNYLGGIQKKTYYLIFGLSGAGKTCYALYSFIFRPLMDNPNGNFLIIYFSLEMSCNKLLAKLLSLYLYETYGIIVSYKKLFSFDEILDDTIYSYVVKARQWLDSIMHHLVIYDKSLNRDIFYRTMMDELEKNGEFSDSDDGRRKLYVPNDPDKLILGIIDHVGLVMPKPGENKKSEIDAISAYAVTLRERCGTSFLMLQQENRNSSNMDRRKAEMTECSSEDLKDTGNTFNDCEVCIGIYYPLKHKLKSCHQYPIITDPGSSFDGLRDRYRGLCLIKNRDGDSEKYISTNFYGELGLFKELPKPEEIKDYAQYLSLKCIKEELKDETPRQESKTEIIYNF